MSVGAAHQWRLVRVSSAVLLAAFALPRLSADPKAQTPAAVTPEFSVASVRPNRSGEGNVRFGVDPGGSLTIVNIPLREIIRVAYQVQDYQFRGPDSLMARYDILAKAEFPLPPFPPPPAFDAPNHPAFPMLRALLADRFKLVVHSETRDLPMFSLVLARADKQLGPKLTPSGTDCVAVLAARRAAAQQPNSQQPPLVSGGSAVRQCGWRGRQGGIDADSQPMSQLVQVLSGWAGRAVIDRTNLTGLFNFTLDFAPDHLEQLRSIDPDNPSLAETDKPTFFTAVQEQLGLKLVPTKEPAQVIVVDRVEEPTPN